MSADYLRETARMMRAVAEGIPVGPWEVVQARTAEGEHALCAPGYQTLTPRAVTLATLHGGDAPGQHMAQWHPDVARAVAEWLEIVAGWTDEGLGRVPNIGETNYPDMWGHMTEHAHIVAMAWRGESAPLCGCQITCSVCGHPATGTETGSAVSSPDGRHVMRYPTATRVVPCGDYGHTIHTLCPAHARNA